MAPRRRALSVDLRDHGESPRSAADFAAATVVDDVAALVDRAGLNRVVPVALSHAGWMAIELRRRLGAERVSAIVLLGMVLGPPPGFGEALAGLQYDSSWQQVRAGLFEMWTTGVAEPGVHDYVAGMGRYGFRHWRRAAREITAAFAEHGSPVCALERLDPACPTLHVYAQPGEDALLAVQHAAAAGAVTAVVCATRGEAGQPAPGSGVHQTDLGTVRERELRAAARLLGVSRVYLVECR